MRRLPLLISVVLVMVLVACVHQDGTATRTTPKAAIATITALPTTPGTQGWLLCLSTDRPIYHPGDTVNGRVVILDAVTFAPTTTRIPINLRLLNPRDHVTATSLAWSVDGIAPFTWTLTSDAVEGGYRVTADTATPSAPAERALIVTTERTPTLDLQLHQEREAWVPGETANVRLSVRHHNGIPVSAATVRINATVDGVVIDLTTTALDAMGETTLRIPLPATFSSGVLTAIIDDHGHLEQISCQLRRVTRPLVELIPESGALLSGIPNVLYLQAWRRTGEPLALRGDLIDDQQRVVTEIRTSHEGRARVIFTPQSGRQYRLLVREPSAVDNLHPLPAVHDHGVVLHARDERIAADQPARLDLTSTTIGQHRVELTRRGAAVASIVVPCSPRVTQAIELPLPPDVDGVLEVTVSGPDGTRLAQRLLFREPKRRLTVTVVPDQARRGLDEDAGVTVRVVDEHGRPAAALVSVAVVDAGTTTSLPPRERPPRLPVMALLENEVEHCADPTAYLGNAQALDLLLGTQAWRRLIDPRSPPPATTPTRELALRRLLMQRHVWPEWPAMLAADATAPVPGLSSRHRGLPAQPSTPGTPLPPVKPSGGATDWALNWMIRTQRGDGSWSPTHPAEEIRRDTERTGIAPWSGPDADRATTALMLLSYLGAGYDHKTPNKYKKRVAQGLAWLMTQAPDGRFSHDATIQGVVTCCLAEAYAMTNDAALKPLCKQAIAAVLADQVQWQGQRLGWSTTPADAPICDADASMWCVTALKSALAGGLAIGDGMEGAKAYLTAAWTAANAGRTGNDTAKLGTFPTRWDPRTNTCQLPHSPANGLLMAVFLGFHRGDARTDGLAEHVFRRYYPPGLPLPLIEDYLATMGLFQVGGDYWDQWNRMYRDLMVNLQEDRVRSDVGTHLRGSWDPRDFDAFAATGGRMITSAFACLSMEIYYRYHAINSKAADAKENTLAAPAPHELDAGTRLWNAAARTDPLTGNATLRFTTPPRPADLRILVDAVDARGALGSGDGLMRCGAEVTLEARLPQHLRVGDQALVPLNVRDRREPPADTASLRLGTAEVEQLPLRGGMARRLVKLDATPEAAATGHLPIDWEVTAGDHHDVLKRRLPIGPIGFPWEQHRSALVDAIGAAHDCLVPNDLDPESLRGTLTLYPSPAARLQDAVAGLLREPHGCFEQVSATSYPMAMADRLLRTRKKPDAALQARLRGLLGDAYRQLVAYECPDGGFSWWGKAPAHPALTAFGLMQFRDLASSIAVDPALLNRTRTWLLSQRDAAGCFNLTDDQPTWGRACAHTYITWALLESADDVLALAQELAPALIAVERDAQNHANAYVVALAANALLRAGREDAARDALKRLVCAADGSVDGATGSLLGEDRDEARRQTTALALLAWTALEERPQALAAARYLLGTAADGAFGTTQTTVLTLRALAAFEHARPPDADQAVTVTITIDGIDLPTPVTVAATADEPLRIELGSHFTAGAHRLTLRQDGTRHLPWALTLTGSTTTPPVVTPGVGFFTDFNQQTTTLGGTLLLQISWRLAQDLPTPVALIGIPAGLRPLRSALDELVAQDDIAAWELSGDLLVLYWAKLDDDFGQISVPCVAEIPGRFRGPASRIYGYYDRTRQGWSTPLNVTIAAPPGW